jgi:hypothetical protein
MRRHLRFALPSGGSCFLAAAAIASCGPKHSGPSISEHGPSPSEPAPSAQSPARLPEDSVLRAHNASDSALVVQIRQSRQRMDAQFKLASKSLILAALMPDGHLVAVRDNSHWPDSTQTSYVILTDTQGRVMLVDESPTSRSGDWFNTYTHYFDSSGNTVAMERQSSFFTSCWDQAGDSTVPIRETSLYYYDSSHRLVQKDYRLTTFDNTTTPPSKNCNTNYRYQYRISPSWKFLAAATGLEAFLAKPRP